MDSTVYWLFNYMLSLKTNVNASIVRNKPKTFLLASKTPLLKRAGSRSKDTVLIRILCSFGPPCAKLKWMLAWCFTTRTRNFCVWGYLWPMKRVFKEKFFLFTLSYAFKITFKVCLFLTPLKLLSKFAFFSCFRNRYQYSHLLEPRNLFNEKY